MARLLAIFRYKIYLTFYKHANHLVALLPGRRRASGYALRVLSSRFGQPGAHLIQALDQPRLDEDTSYFSAKKEYSVSTFWTLLVTTTIRLGQGLFDVLEGAFIFCCSIKPKYSEVILERNSPKEAAVIITNSSQPSEMYVRIVDSELSLHNQIKKKLKLKFSSTTVSVPFSCHKVYLVKYILSFYYILMSLPHF